MPGLQFTLILAFEQSVAGKIFRENVSKVHKRLTRSLVNELDINVDIFLKNANYSLSIPSKPECEYAQKLNS